MTKLSLVALAAIGIVVPAIASATSYDAVASYAALPAYAVPSPTVMRSELGRSLPRRFDDELRYHKRLVLQLF